VRGIPPGVVMAELFGKATGCSKGKGGSMHLSTRAGASWAATASVATHSRSRPGSPSAAKYQGGDQVCVCFFGEAR